MNRFSIAQGIVSAPVLGVRDAPRNLRVAVWNELASTVLEYNDDRWRPKFQTIWDFLHIPIDEVPYQYSRALSQLKNYVLHDSQWFEFFDLLQFVAQWSEPYGPIQYFETWNMLLANEGCPYRLIDNKLRPLTTEEEVQPVEEALTCPLSSVREHISTALDKLSERPEADVRNSIKEAILPVEAALKVTTGRRRGDLRAALPVFESEFGQLHPAFRGAIEKLYRYIRATSRVCDIRYSSPTQRWILTTRASW